MIVIPKTETCSEISIEIENSGRWLYVYQGGEPVIVDRQQALPLLREIIDFLLEQEGYAFKAAGY